MKILQRIPLTYVIERDRIEDRIDATFYHPKYIKIMERLAGSPWQTKRFGDISVKIRKGIFYILASEYKESGIPFIRVSNIRDLGIDTRDLAYISEEKDKKHAKTSLRPGHLVISKGGTIGRIAIIPEEMPKCNISQDVISVSLKKKEAKPEYVVAFLLTSLGRQQMERGASGPVQAHLTLETIRELRIPIPPVQIQGKIGEIVLNAFEKRKKKLKKITEFMGRVNHIVTKRLGIILETQRLPDKSFVVKRDDLEDRLDPGFYSSSYSKLIDSIEKCPFKIRTLQEITKLIVSGHRPRGGVKYIEEGVPSIGGEHITSEGDFDFEELRFIPEEFHLAQKKSWIHHGDILIVKDGATTGKVAIVREDFPFKECNINEHVFKVTLKEGFDPCYVFSYLFSYLGQKQIERLISGAAQRGITRSGIRKIRIVVPSIDVQHNVADNVKRLMDEVKRSKKEVDEVVDKAVKKAEKIIEGKIKVN